MRKYNIIAIAATVGVGTAMRQHATGRQLVNRHPPLHTTPESRTASHFHSPQNSPFDPYPQSVERIMVMTRAEINRLTKQRGKVPWLRFYKISSGGLRPADHRFGLRAVVYKNQETGLERRLKSTLQAEARATYLTLMPAPGLTPSTIFPSRTTSTPFTKTKGMPSEYRFGFSNVALS